ncbi:uncharacterized protein KY384_004729 [Bacidia gigantensis]|uniref:uncharacterized protein n=1 Tax=Bacidia gigantensis TaxID=2732470 RepID=UPI001D039D9C|nr:uncharacterized protein KY384_004729 [Bacidia gigantensis]KAG8530229.1 hypothetical protein KY384_004729 [Bacidia gigantensis]
MDRLPLELLDAIFQYLTPLDHQEHKVGLSSLRFLCKRIASAVAPHLFSTIPVWISAKSLKNLDDLSKHPEICQFVEEIRFSPLQVTSPMSWLSPSEQVIWDFNPPAEAIEGFIDAERHRIITEEYMRCQEGLLNNSDAIQLLCTALYRLSNLKAIDFIVFSHKIGAAELRAAYPTFTHEEYHWDCLAAIDVFIPVLRALPQPIQSLRFSEDERDYSHDPTRHLVKSGAETDSMNIAIELAELDWSHLRSLEMQYHKSSKISTRGIIIEKFGKAVQSFIRRAPKLTSLTILSKNQISIDTVNGISGLLEGIELQNLERLHLSSMTLSEDSLCTFLSYHSLTLRRITLDCVRITEPNDWPSFLHRWRSLYRKKLGPVSSNLKLFRLLFCDISHLQTDVDVAPFLKAETDVSPFDANDIEIDDEVEDSTYSSEPDPEQDPLEWLSYGESPNGSEYDTPDWWSENDEMDALGESPGYLNDEQSNTVNSHTNENGHFKG